MFKRYSMFVCTAIIILLCITVIGCANDVVTDDNKVPTIMIAQQPPPVTREWHGMEIILDDGMRSKRLAQGRAVPILENVITTESQTLRLNHADVRIEEYIQVYIDGAWYTIPFTPNREDEVDPTAVRRTSFRIHDIYLENIGGLLPGRYRFVWKTYLERFRTEQWHYVYFWVINPGDERPSESERTGEARIEDFTLYVASIYEARRSITDRDTMLGVFINLNSGREYVVDRDDVVLERRQRNGSWQAVRPQHINAGLMFGWESSRKEVFLNEPLQAGRYRITLQPYRFNRSYDRVTIEYEFDVIAHRNAPEPKWDISRLRPSLFDKSDQSKGIKMSVVNPILDRDNTKLELKITPNIDYLPYSEYSEIIFGDPFSIDVLIDGRWYQLPFANCAFFSIGHFLCPTTETTITRHPVFQVGILPAGQYRIIKEFDVWENLSENQRNVLSREIAMAEFTVKEVLGQ